MFINKEAIMSFGEIDHFATMLSGCESINAGGPLTSDGRYALEVLKLHANDAGYYAGQEGFLDVIRGAASNIKEWILSLIRAIRNWFRSRKKPTPAELKEIEAASEFIKAQLHPDTQLAEQLGKTKHMVGEWLNYCDISEERSNWDEAKKQFPKITCVETVRKRLDKLKNSLDHSGAPMPAILEMMEAIFIDSEKEVSEFVTQVEQLTKRSKSEKPEGEEKELLRTAGGTMNRMTSILHECQTYYDRLKNAILAASKAAK